MNGPVFKHVASHAANHYAKKRGLSPRAGWELMRSRNVPLGQKVLALGIGVTILLVVIALEIPLEGVLAVIAPALGLVADIAFDGLEVLILPMLIACCLLSVWNPIVTEAPAGLSDSSKPQLVK